MYCCISDRYTGALTADWIAAIESNESSRTAADVIADHLNADSVEIDDELSVYVVRGDHGSWLNQDAIDELVQAIG